MSLPFLFAFMTTIFSFAGNKIITVEQWNPIDLEFKSGVTWSYCPTEPFEIDFYAEVTGPDNNKFTIPGFYDGDDPWKIRFSPNKEGGWIVKTHSKCIELDQQQIILK